jgi:hypothetical protein
MLPGPFEEEPRMDTPQHRLSEGDERVVAEIVEEHIRISCDVVEIDEATWAIHGSIAVDGDILVAEFPNRADAEAALEEIAAAEDDADAQ